MKNIRNGVFETNSSSTHVICIHKQEELKLPEYVYFGLKDMNDIGYESDLQERANYLHTIIAAMSKTTYTNLKAQVVKVLKKYNIKSEWAKISWALDGDSYNAYDIHSACMSTICKTIIPNEKLLLQYLFGNKSTILVEYDGCTEEMIADFKKNNKEEYEYYDEY